MNAKANLAESVDRENHFVQCATIWRERGLASHKKQKSTPNRILQIMKSITNLAIQVIVSLTALANAEERPNRPDNTPREFPPELIERFDADKDGELSESERKEMRKEMKERHQKMKKKFDVDGDGKISPDERDAMREAMKAKHRELLGKYDENDNGRLDPEERKVAIAAGEELPMKGGKLRSGDHEQPKGSPGDGRPPGEGEFPDEE